MTVELIQGLLLTFALMVILMPPYIRLLQAIGFGKRIRQDGPETHYAKEGTPTMGGLLIVGVVLGIYFFLRPQGPDASTFAPIAALAGVGLLGAFDDYLNARTGEGIKARQKLIWLTVVAFVAAYNIQRTYAITAIAVPFVGAVNLDPALYILFGAFAIIATANGVNLTDGLDGLSGGTVAISFVAFMFIALLNVPNQANLALLCALIIGALLGFLWFNVHPAQIFIGDSGALSLGATLAVTALITGQILVLPLDRDHLRGGDGLGHPAGRVLPADRGRAPVSDESDPPPLRAWRLGRGEDHHPLLDRGDPGRAPRGDPLPGHAPAIALSRLQMVHPLTIDPAALTLDALRGGLLRDRPVTVLGLARSGVALTRFLTDQGARVTVYDGRAAERLAEAIAALGDRPVRLVLGPHEDPARSWEGAALVTTSPAISPDFPTTEPRLRAALGRLVAVRRAGDTDAPALVSEPDLFLRLCPAPTIGVTGTKGKTTTSSLIAAILASDPSHPVVLGGNIGTPIVERLPDLTPDHRVVYELSELQLPTLSRGTTVAVYTNVTADHLDRHGSLEAYRRAKRRLAELADPAGAMVLNAEDPVVAAYAGMGVPRAVLYRRSRPMPGGVGVVDGWIVADDLERLALAGGGVAGTGPGAGSCRLTTSRSRVPITTRNALAAVAVGLLFGVAPDAIRSAAAEFTGVEHRLETVAVIDGVRFVNDSQGTQPDAVIAALEAFPAPIVLIAGGRDKGVDLSALGPAVARRASAAVLIGESGPDLERRFRDAGLATTELAGSLEVAVDRADALAREAAGGEGLATVLLSPAAASFDMFVDYAARGRAFKAAVAALAARRTGRDT
ncbi:MAG: UDP-N-acetylmuramoyl-L-alanine--D-glutamate ligase [Candidatus Limnocylindrales bacterium]